MNNQCQDRDLLTIEPGIFTGGSFESQQLAAGSDGRLSGTAFTSAAGGFIAAGTRSGMVIGVYTTVPAEARCYEIVSVDSATQLTVSVGRAQLSDPPMAPPAGSSLKYFILSFAPQLAQAAATLGEKLRQIGEAEGIAGLDYADSSQFRLAVALGTLATVLTARATGPADSDANWAKAEHYRARQVEACGALRLARDADGDGVAEQTRTLGCVSLRRV